MRADRDRSCRAYAGQSHLSYTYRTDQELVQASQAASAYCLRNGSQPMTSTMMANGQRGRDQDRDVPVWCALIVRRAEYEVDGRASS
jgi:hypothetical protein